ncbi:helix-turn-helix domain-containing protein [Microbacterium sp. C7(2022)]|uniref:helix-turn-helix domain-containing protein n=1 Tax=Microbacterium sp. C7(2022) TaxID=2992759 RepID=UPI00237A70EB|nr:helix-turn-helix domain-containing protein [Microbacterium sp. C7(2022)]
MQLRPRATLGRVLDDLGDTLLDLVVGESGDPREIGGLVIHDPLDEVTLPRRALVLGVGLGDPGEIQVLLEELAERDAIGLILRGPIPADDAMRQASARGGVSLLSLRRGASWSHLAALLRSLLTGDLGSMETETLGGIPSGDLFAVANAVAALVDAPVTIEDRESRVLAFSGRQDEADPSRIETILGRQVPERYASVLTERGVFRELLRSDEPIRVEPVALEDGGFTVPRFAVAVRAGDEYLGSIWVAVAGDLNAERRASLRDSATLVALHLMQVRAGADVQRRLHTDLISSALEGGASAQPALARLGLGDQPLLVLGVTLLDAPEPTVDVARAADRSRLADAFSMHLAAAQPGATAALVGDVVYGLVPLPGAAGRGGAGGGVRPGGRGVAARGAAAGRGSGGAAAGRGSTAARETSAVRGTASAAAGRDIERSAAGAASVDHAEERARRICDDFLERVGRRLSAVVGIGPVAADIAALPRARATVDQVLRVLREGGTVRAAPLSDVQTETLVLELRDHALARGDTPTGPVARLMEYDAEHSGDLVDTLRAWLDAFGDVSTAAARLFVHPNTFRYRLRRIAEVGGIDLDDPEQRFAAMLQLRVLAPRGGR